ncbi:MAG: LacI family DNA-binding transcriptional regulator [Victivallales bacterium]|nr:LacI family DNA-binding transcriptional regulator [Victivallales bacterium]
MSKATVSLVLNGKAKSQHISDDTIHAVLSYARANNYQPNFHAVRIRRKIVNCVMLLLNTQDRYNDVNSFSDYNVAMLTGGIAGEVRRSNFSLLVRLFVPGKEEEMIYNSFRNHEIDGMLYYGVSLPKAWTEVFQRENFKVVCLGASPQPGVSTINIDNREMSRMLTAKLLKAGCRRFLFFAGFAESFPARERYEGFLEALREHRLPWRESSVIEANFDEATAYRCMLRHCHDNAELPDAVVCANDSMALGVLRALKERGVKIPAQVRVTGGDNIAVSAYCSPSLTTFDNMTETMGVESFRMLNRMINGQDGVRHVVLKSKILKREST